MSTDDTTHPEADAPTGVVRYREHPRGYRETLWVSLAFAVGFAVDAGFNLGGAITHLPGWLIAAAVVVGVDAVLVASARSTHTLVVTDDEVWVGEEMITRTSVAGTTPPDTVELPVLGWPTGKPGRTKGVALRLDDGRDVLVPTRYPSRLAGLLDAAPAPVRDLVAIRTAEETDLDELAEIDARAEIVFGLSGVDLPAIEWQPPDDRVAVFVANDPPVGFVILTEVDGLAHIAEIAVLPGVMRTGLGSRLLEHACSWARESGYDAVTLCTFRDVAWNGPWYSARGFSVVEPSGALALLRENEKNIGLDDAGPRVAMRRELTA